MAFEGITPDVYFTLAPRIGSGFFVRAKADWIRQFDAMGKGSAPPDWLAARPGTTIYVVRNGHAYAVRHPARLDSVCHVDFEVVAPSGKTCGSAAFPARQSGQFCAGYPVVGDDGTVIDAAVDDGAHDRAFTFRWWTGFLR